MIKSDQHIGRHWPLLKGFSISPSEEKERINDCGCVQSHWSLPSCFIELLNVHLWPGQIPVLLCSELLSSNVNCWLITCQAPVTPRWLHVFQWPKPRLQQEEEDRSWGATVTSYDSHHHHHPAPPLSTPMESSGQSSLMSDILVTFFLAKVRITMQIQWTAMLHSHIEV